MKKIYIILLSIIGVISSCTKHEDIIDTSLQPGSILCSDGSIVHPSYSMFLSKSFYEFNIFLTSVNLAL